MTSSLACFGLLRLLGYLTEPSLDDHQIHQIVGEPARVSPPVEGWKELKVLTWNIHRGTEFDKVRSTLRDLAPDICLLQEVDLFCRRSAKRNVARDLAEAIGANWIFSGEFQEIGESGGSRPALTGQAVLSRYPIEEAGVIRFSSQARLRWRLNPLQPRRGGRIALKARTAGILIYNVHIESGGNNRLRGKQLREVLADEARGARPAPVIIAGDFNNAAAGRSSMFVQLATAAFVDALGEESRRATVLRRSHPIDWIFVRNLKPTGGEVRAIDGASDHYPVLATLAVGR